MGLLEEQSGLGSDFAWVPSSFVLSVALTGRAQPQGLHGRRGHN